MGPLAVRSESLTGFPSVPLSVKSGAFCPTSSALAAPTSSTLANSASNAATMVRDAFIERLLPWCVGSSEQTRVQSNTGPGLIVPRGDRIVEVAHDLPAGQGDGPDRALGTFLARARRAAGTHPASGGGAR